jgi:hypothetical protein
MLRKYLIWDFDGTLGYRSGAWRGPLAEVLLREIPESKLTAADFRPYLPRGISMAQSGASAPRRAQ